MASNYAIVRHEKRYRPSEVNGIWAENIRSIMGKNVDEKRSHSNITLTPLPFDNYDDFAATRKQQIHIANKERKTKARMPRITKNKKTGNPKFPAMMQEFVFTHTNGAMSTNESIRYCRLANKFICDWFSKSNVILSIIHLDEETPHVHIWTDYYDKLDNRFIQSVLQDEGKTDINAIRNAWQEKLTEEGFDLLKQDGSVVGNKHDGTKASKEKGKQKKQILELMEDVKTLKKVVLEKTKEYDMLQRRNDITLLEVAEVKKLSKDRLAEINEKDVQIIDFKKEISRLSKVLKDLKQKLLPWIVYIKDKLGLDILKEVPPAVLKEEFQIQSTLQNDTVDETNIGIPSLIN